MIGKVKDQHTRKPAYIYLRQSTMAQVHYHQESTERQYALKDKALQLGWTPSMIRILDRDLGVSGSHMTGREDLRLSWPMYRWARSEGSSLSKPRAWLAPVPSGIGSSDGSS